MTWTRTATAALTAASIAAVFGACTGAGGLENPTQSTASSRATTSAAPTKPTAASPTTKDSPTTTYEPNSPQERAKETVREYYRVATGCMKNPKETAATCFDSAAVASELADLRDGLSAAKAAQTKVLGDAVVESVNVVKVDLTNKPKESPPTLPKVVVRVCYDVSKVNVVDYRGKSIVPPDRKPRAVEDVTVVNYKYPDPTQWRVGYTVPTGKSC